MKFKFSVFNSSLLITNFYFRELITQQLNINSLVQMHQAHFKWLRLHNCRFNLTNQVVVLNEGVNTEVQNSFIDISRANAIIQIYGTNKCQYFYTEGIGNNLILNNLTFTGKNNIGLNRLIVAYKPMNVTITNTDFIDAQWQAEAFGLVSGYPETITVCTQQNQYFIDTYDNNRVINKVQTLSNIPMQIWLQIPNNP